MSDTITAQEIFDRVWQRFVVERAPRAVNVYGGCMYRTPGGRMCAVGCLLTDEEAEAIARARGNDSPVDTLRHRGLLPARLVPHVSLLRRLQATHDGPEFDGDRARRLRGVANLFDLTIPGEVQP
jgi:hypothetical protein